MKRYSGVEWCALGLGIILVVAGFILVIWPHSMVVIHLINDATGFSYRSGLEGVSADRSKIYGGISIILGAGLAWAATYQGKR